MGQWPRGLLHFLKIDEVISNTVPSLWERSRGYGSSGSGGHTLEDAIANTRC
jgi:hypothetical protein